MRIISTLAFLSLVTAAATLNRADIDRNDEKDPSGGGDPPEPDQGDLAENDPVATLATSLLHPIPRRGRRRCRPAASLAHSVFRLVAPTFMAAFRLSSYALRPRSAAPCVGSSFFSTFTGSLAGYRLLSTSYRFLSSLLLLSRQLRRVLHLGLRPADDLFVHDTNYAFGPAASDVGNPVITLILAWAQGEATSEQVVSVLHLLIDTSIGGVTRQFSRVHATWNCLKRIWAFLRNS